MSQSAKRDAETAFQGEPGQTQSRRKRIRNRREHQKSTVTAPNLSEPKKHTHPDRQPQDDSEETLRTKKLEVTVSDPYSNLKDSIETTKTSSKSKKNKRKRNKVENHQPGTSNRRPKQKGQSSGWSISSARGGIFIDHDPILTADGQFLVLLTKDLVHVYSVSTSLLVRSIAVKERDAITCCSLAVSDSNTLIVATRKGNLAKLDLNSGAILGRWKIKSGIVGITSVSSHVSSDLVLATVPIEGEEDQLQLLTLESGEKLNSQVLFQAQRLLKSSIVCLDASIIVVAAIKAINLGILEDESSLKYTWYELPLSGSISSFDVRTRKQSNSKKKSGSIDLVVGLENGAIFLYEDIASKLVKNARGGQRGDLNPRKLHWHRTTVRSLKWSRDGNYLISGGDETVLVIWQLETNQQQFLPHLSTSIHNITVSSTGAYYALQLGDNSTMVLATADLLPSTNVTGILMPFRRNEKCPVLLHTQNPNQLLAAVPIRSTGKSGKSSATHLQTYDIDSDLQLNRQALTRNVTTAVNVSPHGQSLHEPNVTHLQMSPDGQWLATIDVWLPSHSDTQALYLREDQSTQQNNSETVLRFWNWNPEGNNWELINRIDEPHSPSNSSILAIASNPATTEFSTLGADGYLKVWQPRRRVRDGVQVHNKNGQPLFTWTCTRSVLADSNERTQPPSGTLTYSNDGSILVASWSGRQRHVHLIDTATGSICMSLPNLLSEGHAILASIGRYLLCLSTGLKVFDMITLQTVFALEVNRYQDSFLVVNSRANIFAIGLNPVEKGKSGLISVFDIENMDQGSLNDFEIPGRIHTLLADPLEKGFIIIDNESRSRKLVAPGSVTSAQSALIQAVDDEYLSPSKNLGDMFGHAPGVPVRTKEQKLIEGVEDSRKLCDLFTATSTATQLGVNELFDQISQVVSSRQVRVDA